MSDALDAALAALARFEAEAAVRRTLTRYMALCDVPCAALDGETLAALFCPDAIWEGIGPAYANKFGRLHGKAEILAMLTRYLPPTPHFSVNTHFLSSEMIEVDAGLQRAKGRWVMLQASGYVDGRAELMSARLEVDFVPASEDGNSSWLISHFRTRRLFDAPWQVNAPPTSEPAQ
jgi:hypothetical protein